MLLKSRLGSDFLTSKSRLGSDFCHELGVIRIYLIHVIDICNLFEFLEISLNGWYLFLLIPYKFFALRLSCTPFPRTREEYSQKFSPISIGVPDFYLGLMSQTLCSHARDSPVKNQTWKTKPAQLQSREPSTLLIGEETPNLVEIVKHQYVSIICMLSST